MKYMKDTSCTVGTKKIRDNYYYNEKFKVPILGKILVPPSVTLKKFWSTPLTD